VTAVAFSPDGHRLASAGFDRVVKVWDAGAFREERTIPGHTKEVTCVSFSPDGRRLASGSKDQTVRVWDPESGQEVAILLGHASAVRAVAFSPDGRRLASAGDFVRVWDPASGKELSSLRGHTQDVLSLAFSSDGGRLASASLDGTVRLWDARTGPEFRPLLGHVKAVNALAFSPDGERLASAGEDGALKIWRVRAGSQLLDLGTHAKPVTSVAYSPDGRRLASACYWDLTVWDARTGQGLFGVEMAGDQVLFTPDGQRLLVAGYQYQETGHVLGELTLLDAATGQKLEAGPTAVYPDQIRSLALSPDGAVSAGAFRDAIALWEVRADAFGTGPRCLIRASSDDVGFVIFSPDGKRVAFPSGGFRHGPPEVKVVELADFAAAAKARKTRPMGNFSVLSVSERDDLLTLRGHAAEVFAAAFSHDGKRIVTASADRTVKVWDATTGVEVLTLRGHADAVTRVAFSPDDRIIASAGRDGAILLWDSNPVRGTAAGAGED
jgi:WD40 repeat protein